MTDIGRAVLAFLQVTDRSFTIAQAREWIEAHWTGGDPCPKRQHVGGCCWRHDHNWPAKVRVADEGAIAAVAARERVPVERVRNVLRWLESAYSHGGSHPAEVIKVPCACEAMRKRAAGVRFTAGPWLGGQQRRSWRIGRGVIRELFGRLKGST